MAITDLTGYRWLHNARWTNAGANYSGTSTKQWNVNISFFNPSGVETKYSKIGSHTYESYTRRYLNCYLDGKSAGVSYSDTGSPTTSLLDPEYQSYSGHETYFVINGGSDATNPSAIAWFEANGTLIFERSITYHANGGIPIPENLIKQIKLPNPLPSVSKANFTFNGWYYDDEFQNEAYAGDTLSSNVDLYAKFKRNRITLDLSTINLIPGVHNIRMKLSDDNITKFDSKFSNTVVYLAAYQITTNITNGTYSGDTEILPSGTATITISANTYYDLPSSVSVTGATLTSYDQTTGEIVISNPTGTIYLTATCPATEYTITGIITNGSISSDPTITHFETKQIEIGPDAGYFLPVSAADITITNATLVSYDATTGMVIINNATGNVTITATCPEKWQTPTLTLNENVISSAYVDGVTKYKITANGNYIGYIDENNEWNGVV